MNDFIQQMQRIAPLTEAASHALEAAITDITYDKGTNILSEGMTCRYLFFLRKGLVKFYFYKDDKAFVMRFFQEGSLFTGLDSYIRQQGSAYYIEALEPVQLSRISYRDMESLCARHHSIETMFRKFLSTAALNMMDRISEMLEENGTERYNNFVRENGALLQRISLGDLAAYLGITQVSLSRIRARK